MNSDKTHTNVDSYISSYPVNVQTILNKIRATVKEAAPEAVESIAYEMPAYKQNGKPLVYFAAFTHHIGFYATPEAHAGFAAELGKYKQGKGSVQFPLDQPMPYALIARMTKYKAGLLSSGATK